MKYFPSFSDPGQVIVAQIPTLPEAERKFFENGLRFLQKCGVK
jgi:hypothetical protein